MRIALAADHHGVTLAASLIERLTALGHVVTAANVPGAGEVVDYPPRCAAAGRLVAEGRADLAIVIGGSGQGEVIACNKVPGVRAGLAYSRFAVEISRGNNNANVMVLPTLVISEQQALELVDLWLTTPFKGGRHQQRVDQITALDARPSTPER